MRRPPTGALLGILAAASLATLLLAPMYGSEPIRSVSAFGELIGTDRVQWSEDARILYVRLPRVLLAWLTGGALAVCGAVMQTLLRNGLAEPYTLGVSAAASFGAFLSIAFPQLALLGAMTSQRVTALAFALAEVALVLGVARRSRRADGLILAGIIFSALFGAGIVLVKYLADPYLYQNMDRWLMGSLEAVTFSAPLSLLPWIAAGAALVAASARPLDFLAFDTELAAARGMRPERAQTLALAGASIMTAAVVAHSGPVGFIGLLVPHALRPFTGLRHGVLLPACWLAGGGFLVLADLAARSLPLFGRHSEMPVGILTALIGAPFFLLLLLRRQA
ncbi:MAG: iron ABC transporter permease [Planctomycetota bacterium]|nr:MAG: iron ABC transporter permease [Planctomycetota bacterium]